MKDSEDEDAGCGFCGTLDPRLIYSSERFDLELKYLGPNLTDDCLEGFLLVDNQLQTDPSQTSLKQLLMSLPFGIVLAPPGC